MCAWVHTWYFCVSMFQYLFAPFLFADFRVVLSTYIYCVTLIAEYYVQGCMRWRKARTYLGIPGIRLWNHRDRKAIAKPHTFRQIFFPYKYFVPGWTRTPMEEVCSSVVKYSATTNWAILAPMEGLNCKHHITQQWFMFFYLTFWKKNPELWLYWKLQCTGMYGFICAFVLAQSNWVSWRYVTLKLAQSNWVSWSHVTMRLAQSNWVSWRYVTLRLAQSNWVSWRYVTLRLAQSNWVSWRHVTLKFAQSNWVSWRYVTLRLAQSNWVSWRHVTLRLAQSNWVSWRYVTLRLAQSNWVSWRHVTLRLAQSNWVSWRYVTLRSETL